MKLYELTEQYRALANMDIDPDMLADTVEGLTGEFEIKAENLLAVVSNMSANVDAISSEITRLTARKQIIKNRQDWLREYLRSNMEVSGIDKITCPLFTITLRKATQAVQVNDVSLLSDDYIKTTIAPDKVAIKSALKSGIEIPGCELVDGKRGLMIK